MAKLPERYSETLLGVMETFKLQGKNPLEEMKNIIQTSDG